MKLRNPEKHLMDDQDLATYRNDCRNIALIIASASRIEERMCREIFIEDGIKKYIEVTGAEVTQSASQTS